MGAMKVLEQEGCEDIGLLQRCGKGYGGVADAMEGCCEGCYEGERGAVKVIRVVWMVL